MAEPTRAKERTTTLYLVKSGDCLSRIAQRFRLSMDRLMLLNPQFIYARDRDLIYPGERVRVR